MADQPTSIADSFPALQAAFLPDRAAGDTGGNVYLSIGAAFNALYDSYTTEQLEFLARYLQASVELTRGEIAKLARTDNVDAE